MNIDTNSKVITTSNNISTSSSMRTQTDDSSKFSDELSSLSSKEAENKNDSESVKKTSESETKKEEISDDSENSEHIEDVIDGLEGAVQEMSDKLNATKDDNNDNCDVNFSIKNEGNVLINNDINVQEQKDLMPQMNTGMNFNSDGQPFANFMNNQNEQGLASSTKDLAEESAILSTMDENIAMANRNRLLSENETNAQKVKTVSNSNGIKKVDKQSNVTLETIVKYDSVLMNESDVDFFLKLVENGQADITQATAKSSKVSKTLADMLAKSMKDNQPIRIDFDNNISVIIKISKDGKISADFLPSSQVAEAYLKENLPLLKQKFDDNNIDYDELNHRQRKQDEKENQKKEQKDE